MDLSKEFYDTNYQKFSDTRFCLWDVVRDFGSQFKKEDLVLDAGCGNGKNIKYFQEKCNIMGFDYCSNLVSICKKRGYNVFEANILDIPLEDETFDYIMSIAVIHHLDDEKLHLQAICELMRLLKKGGQLLITLWAYESDDYSKKKKFNKGHNFVTFNKSMRYYYVYDEIMLKNMLSKIDTKYRYNYNWNRGNWNIIILK
jgi:SAM-dependent methyltransferase